MESVDEMIYTLNNETKMLSKKAKLEITDVIYKYNPSLFIEDSSDLRVRIDGLSIDVITKIFKIIKQDEQ